MLNSSRFAVYRDKRDRRWIGCMIERCPTYSIHSDADDTTKKHITSKSSGAFA